MDNRARSSQEHPSHQGVPLRVATAYVSLLQEALNLAVDGRQIRRLEAVLLVANGGSCAAAASALNCSARSVQLWVRRFLARIPSVTSLRERPRSGRRARFSEAYCVKVLSCEPSAFGFSKWTGRALRTVLQNGSSRSPAPSIRQCQRLLKRFSSIVKRPIRPAQNEDGPIIDLLQDITLGKFR